jgi:hypothetical protein
MYCDTNFVRPLVYLNGSRQTGKSTLALNIFPVEKINYITFDSPFILFSVKTASLEFLKSLPNE